MKSWVHERMRISWAILVIEKKFPPYALNHGSLVTPLPCVPEHSLNPQHLVTMSLLWHTQIFFPNAWPSCCFGVVWKMGGPPQHQHKPPIDQPLSEILTTVSPSQWDQTLNLANQGDYLDRTFRIGLLTVSLTIFTVLHALLHFSPLLYRPRFLQPSLSKTSVSPEKKGIKRSH